MAIRLLGGHAFPDYDATFALIWGHDLLHGRAPDYGVPLRPAGHPLLLAATTLLAPFGRSAAAEVLSWIALLGAGAMVAALWRLGREVSGPVTAGVGALLLATRSPLWAFGLLGFMDPWAAAFVLWAAALEVRTPRRGPMVFVLLALGGLIRPETWLLAGAYWLWCFAGDLARGWRLLPLAALGPLLWIAWDFLTTQTFLGSVKSDPNVPATSTAGTGISHSYGALARYVGGFARPAELVAAVIGVVIAIWVRDRRMVLPAMLIALNVLTFVLVAIQGGPLEQRYLLVAAAGVILFAAYALAQLAGARPPVRIVAAVMAIACLALAPLDVRRLDRVHDQVAAAAAADRQLRDLVRSPAGTCALRGQIQVVDIRLRPFIAYWGDASPRQIAINPAPAAVEAVDPVAQELVSRSLPRDPHPVGSPAWRLTGPCARQ